MTSILCLFINPDREMVCFNDEIADLLLNMDFVTEVCKYVFHDDNDAVVAFDYIKIAFPRLADSFPPELGRMKNYFRMKSGVPKCILCEDALDLYHETGLAVDLYRYRRCSSLAVIPSAAGRSHGGCAHVCQIHDTTGLVHQNNVFVRDYRMRGYLHALNKIDHQNALECVVYIYLTNLSMPMLVRNYEFVKREPEDARTVVRSILRYMGKKDPRFAYYIEGQGSPGVYIDVVWWGVWPREYTREDMGVTTILDVISDDGCDSVRHILSNDRIFRPRPSAILEFINESGEIYPEIYKDIYDFRFGYLINPATSPGRETFPAVWRRQQEKGMAVIMPSHCSAATIHALLKTEPTYTVAKYRYLQKAYTSYVRAEKKKLQDTVESALEYATSLIHKPYIYYRLTDKILGVEDKFYATSGPGVPKELVGAVNCAGLINLVRRHVGLSVPGVKEARTISGTTTEWYTYLRNRKSLEELDVKKAYPVGTLLLCTYVSEHNQGHLAIICSTSKHNVLHQDIIHAYPLKDYAESKPNEIVGEVNITRFRDSHYFFDKTVGLYTHVCMPERWLMME